MISLFTVMDDCALEANTAYAASREAAARGQTGLADLMLGRASGLRTAADMIKVRIDEMTLFEAMMAGAE